MNIKQDYFFPQIHYFDPDFIQVYEQSWARIESLWVPYQQDNEEVPTGYIDNAEMATINLYDMITSTFILTYSNLTFNPTHILDFFYKKQEANGALHCSYNKETGEKHMIRGNPHGLCPPLLVWAEYNYYNRTDNKKRLKIILPKLDEYLEWFAGVAKDESGLFAVPSVATHMGNLPRENAKYFIDINAQMALAYYYMIQLASTSNLRNLTFKYTKSYYTLKALINKYFWCSTDNFYYDIDENFQPVKIKTICAFWTMLAQIPNRNQTVHLKEYLSDPAFFKTKNLFPTVSVDSHYFTEQGTGHLGAVYSFLTYMIIKGLSLYGYHDFAREATITHISCILANFFSSKDTVGALWEAYQPNDFLPAKPRSGNTPARKDFFPNVGIATVTLIIENVIGFDIFLPKKMVYWTIPHLETMGLESFQLKRNMISTEKKKRQNGWEIRHSSEKLYYFSVDIQEKSIQKTLPIPSGKCTLLIDKL